MPSKDEMRVIQKRELTRLELIKAGLMTLDTATGACVAEMEAEDVAYVKKTVEEMKNKK
jgi:hypothetical protein